MLLRRGHEAASGQATARAGEAVAAVLGDDGSDGQYVPDLMTEWLRVVAVQRQLLLGHLDP